MPCLNCGRGLHRECLTDCEECHPKSQSDSSMQSALSTVKTGAKKLFHLKDPHSTGRKRAVKLLPVDKEQDCEWKGLKNCGGGKFPIMGCVDGKQSNVHHGPHKDTNNNSQGNLHRICAQCHNRWHTLNDLVYEDITYRGLAHSPVSATHTELIAYDLQWKKRGLNLSNTLPTLTHETNTPLPEAESS